MKRLSETVLISSSRKEYGDNLRQRDRITERFRTQSEQRQVVRIFSVLRLMHLQQGLTSEYEGGERSLIRASPSKLVFTRW